MATSESLRKIVHIGIGLFAFSLRWLAPWQAALVAAAAVLHNWLVLPRYLGNRIARSAKGWDLGIVAYPAAVLALILLFPSRPELAAAVWAILAFGDGFATIAGRNLASPPLPWNPEKSVAGSLGFLAAGIPGACAAYHFVGKHESLSPAGIALVSAVVIICATVESLPLNLDDNLTIPFSGALSIWLLSTVGRWPAVDIDRTVLIWLGVNTILAVLGYMARSVDVSGLVGGLLLGAILIVFAGWELYVVLLAFFVIGSGLTRLGYEKKAGLGLAQEGEGRRGFSHAFSNVGVAAICAFLASTSKIDPVLLWLAAIGSLATASADTTGSEIGQLYGRRAFLPVTLTRVPVGTEGAISIEGTVAGFFGGLAVAAVGGGLLHARLAGEGSVVPGLFVLVGVLTIAAFLGSWIESVVGSWNRRRAQGVPNGALNFFNTMVGALLAALLANWVL